MRSFFQKKLWIISLATLALAALTILALSLDEVPFNDAQLYAKEQRAELPPISVQAVVDAWTSVPLWNQIVLWSLIGVMIILLGLLLSPEMRKRLLRMFVRMVLTFFGIWYLLKNYGPQLFGLQPFGGTPVEAGQPTNAPPMPEFVPPP